MNPDEMYKILNIAVSALTVASVGGLGYVLYDLRRKTKRGEAEKTRILQELQTDELLTQERVERSMAVLHPNYREEYGRLERVLDRIEQTGQNLSHERRQYLCDALMNTKTWIFGK